MNFGGFDIATTGLLTADASDVLLIPPVPAQVPVVFRVFGRLDAAGYATFESDASTDEFLYEYATAAAGNFGHESALRTRTGQPVPLFFGRVNQAILLTTSGISARGFVAVTYEMQSV